MYVHGKNRGTPCIFLTLGNSHIVVEDYILYGVGMYDEQFVAFVDCFLTPRTKKNSPKPPKRPKAQALKSYSLQPELNPENPKP